VPPHGRHTQRRQDVTSSPQTLADHHPVAQAAGPCPLARAPVSGWQHGHGTRDRHVPWRPQRMGSSGL
jgi:hypothetical protein